MKRTALLLLLLAAVPLAAACTPPIFHMPAPPAWNQTPLTPPRPPEPREIPLPELAPSTRIEDEAAAPAELAGELRIAILPIEAPRASDAELLESRLELGLLRAGFTRLFNPHQLRTIEAQKVVTRDGTVTWKAPLDRLMRIEPVMPTDLLIELRILEAGVRTLEREQTFTILPEELERYEQERLDYAARTEAEVSKLETERRRFEDDYAKARADYEDDGGHFTPEGATSPVPDERYASGDAAASQRRELLDAIDSIITQLKKNAHNLPTTTQLGQDADTRRRKVPSESFEFKLRARIVHNGDMRIIWLATLHASGNSLEDTAEHILEHILTRVKLLGEQAKLAQPPKRR